MTSTESSDIAELSTSDSAPEIVVVRTGSANLASVLAGLRRIGARCVLSESVAEISDAQILVLPGVGAFGSAMKTLQKLDLVAPIREHVASKKPFIAVCLGLQLLTSESEESTGVSGLGLIDARVTRFSSDVRVPQLGWNRVEPTDGCELLEPGFAYFANSYRIEDSTGLLDDGWSTARTEYDGSFVSAIERGPQLACQFHPELSGKWGIALLRRWYESACRDVGGAPSAAASKNANGSR